MLAPGGRLASQEKLREAERVKASRSLLLVVALATLLPFSIASGKPGWLTDYKQAQEEAKAKQKLVLLDFTGSDWCGWCIKLDREVFTKPEFQDYANKNLVLVEIDFPRGKELSAAQKSQNEGLAQQYEIQGFPTIIVLNGEGKKLGELGYTPGGPSAFIAALDKLRKG